MPVDQFVDGVDRLVEGWAGVDRLVEGCKVSLVNGLAMKQYIVSSMKFFFVIAHKIIFC